MIWRTRECPSAMAARGLIALISVFGIVTLASPLEAGMENVAFALHYKSKFVPSKQMLYLCDNPATTTEETNYSPNFENLPCGSYCTKGPLGAGQVYVVIARAGSEGVSATSFGVNYGGSSGQ